MEKNWSKMKKTKNLYAPRLFGKIRKRPHLLSMSERDIEDRVINKLLHLYLIDKTDQEGVMEDNLKLQKSIFLAQKIFVDKKMKGFSYNFFRWDHGPFSAEVNNDLVSLKKNKFIIWDEDKIYPTEEGKSLLKQCEDIFLQKENNTFLEIINSVIKDNINLKPEEIKEKVYKMKIFVPKIRKTMFIRDIPLKQLLLFKPSKERIRYTFKINKEILATLELIFDEEALEHLRRGYKDAINGRVCKLCL